MYICIIQIPSNVKEKVSNKSIPLFKMGPDQILRRYVREGEFFDILLAYHDGPCGGHFAAKRTSF